MKKYYHAQLTLSIIENGFVVDFGVLTNIV